VLPNPSGGPRPLDPTRRAPPLGHGACPATDPDMIANRRRASVLVLAACAGLASTVDLGAQEARRRASRSAGDAAEQASGQDDVAVLPANLLPVKGGEFEIGLDAKTLLELQEKLWLSPQQRVGDIQRLMSEIGTKKVTVEPFFLAKFPVTNVQFKAFVEATGHRFPYHWWRYGREDDYQQRLKDINETVRDEAADKGVEYWKVNWKDLPWQIPNDEVRSGQFVPMDHYPVVYVSWYDALAYAAWAGMRLPREIEWTYAGSGGEPRQFVWGDDPDGLQVQRGSRFDRLWEVGHWGAATAGPFGHQDMVLGVWEWTGDLGFFSFPDDKKDFEKQLELLFKDKIFKKSEDPKVQQTMKYRPAWAGDKVVAKGGMWTSIKSELRVGVRADIEPTQTVSALGFRLAKSPIPARDVSESRIKLDYDYSYFGAGRRPNLADQVGIERYDLSPDGDQILGYHAISIVPTNFASEDKAPAKDKLFESTIEENRPFVFASLVTTEKLDGLDLAPGIYTLAFRHSGQPADLRAALPAAQKALRAAQKAGGEPEAGDWQKAMSKYGITDEEARTGDVDFIRLVPGNLQVTTKEHRWILRDQKGDYVASFKCLDLPDTTAKYADGDATVAIEVRPDGKERIEFNFGVPVDPKTRGRAFVLRLRLELAAENAGGDKWRLPTPKPK
jgi:formylglycine-generating enzyme required for sulfatase activity